eukprot:GGOE01012459.1.p1 GENE.GGOE01012459.1~~GGOE01012459.1.p1  ORF type:complete len:487 (-),score=82.03 GGOE01012459.1:2823-4145(-)
MVPKRIATVPLHDTGRSIVQERKGTNVYVSNLPATMTASRFRAVFAPFGIIIGARLVKRRKGDAPVGFVQYTRADMAQAAIKTLDGRQVDGSKLSVRLANRDKDKGIDNKPSSNLYVANLPQKVTELDLRILFSRYGDILSLRVLKYPNTGVSKGTALVRFMTIEDATRAKDALHCLPLHGQDLPLEVKFAETKEEKMSRRDDRGQVSKLSKPQAGTASCSQSSEGQWDEMDFQHGHDDDGEGDAVEDVVCVPPCPEETESPRCMSPKLSPEQSENAIHALTDYMKFMMGTKSEPEVGENISWVSHSSSNNSTSGPADSLGCEISDGMATPKAEPLQLSIHTQPFIPKMCMPEICLPGDDDTSMSDSIMVKRLPPSIDKLGLYELLGPLGAILKLESVLDADSCTRTAIVKFRSVQEALAAQSKLDGMAFYGFTLDAKLF